MTSDKVTFNGVGDFDPHSPSSEGTPNVPVASVAGSGNYVKGAAQKDAQGNLPIHIAATSGATLRAAEECLRIFPAGSRARPGFS